MCVKWLKIFIPYLQKYETAKRWLSLSQERQRELEKQLRFLEREQREGLKKKTLQTLENLLRSPNIVVLELQTDDESATIVALEMEGFISGESKFSFQLFEVRARLGVSAQGSLYAGIREGLLEIYEISGPKNRGWGSLLMHRVLTYAKAKNCHAARAWLSQVDLGDKNDPEHRERLFHFYEKHGFAIKTDKRGELWAKLALPV